MLQAEHRAKAPHCTKPEKNDECHSEHASGHGAFAPALEHGNHSYHEQQHGNATKNLKPHDSISPLRT
jgi:hypothetical protein